jgi:hypothetical protein
MSKDLKKKMMKSLEKISRIILTIFKLALRDLVVTINL